MRTITKNVYKFTELSKEVQEKVIENIRNSDWYLDYDWYDFIFEDFRETTNYFEVGKIYFRGFSSQGDGAMFEYSSVKKDLINEIIDSFVLPEWKKKVLKSVQFYCSGIQQGHYYHEHCCSHSFDCEDYAEYPNISDLIDSYFGDIEEKVIEKYQELCRELFGRLSNDYDYLRSSEAISEFIENNSYEYFEDGSELDEEK